MRPRASSCTRDHKYALLPCRVSRPKSDVSGNAGLFSSCMLDASENISACRFTERVSHLSFLLKVEAPWNMCDISTTLLVFQSPIS